MTKFTLDCIYGPDAHDPVCVLTMIVTLIQLLYALSGTLFTVFSLYLHLFTVIAHSFCIGELFIDCINNLHMYRTLFQAGMFKTVCVKAPPVWASPLEIMGSNFGNTPSPGMDWPSLSSFNQKGILQYRNAAP